MKLPIGNSLRDQRNIGKIKNYAENINPCRKTQKNSLYTHAENIFGHINPKNFKVIDVYLH
jgi:hypothetical protein